MKITNKSDLPAILSSKALTPTPDSDLQQKPKLQRPPRRKPKTPSAGGLRLKRDGATAGKRSRPETPQLHWKFDEVNKGDVSVKEEGGSLPPEVSRRGCRKVKCKGTKAVVSARKLGAVLWRLQLPEVPSTADCGGESKNLPKNDQLGFQVFLLLQYGASHIGLPFLGHHNIRAHSSESKDSMQSPRSVNGPRNGYSCKLEPPFHLSNSAMEGATKWDPICLKNLDETEPIYGHPKHTEQQAKAISALSEELEQAQARIQELETEKRSSKKKLEHFLRKLSEERAAWRSREHEKVRAIIDDIKADLIRERKARQRLDILNSKLVSELADAKLSAKRYIQDYEKERKARELIEEVCDELAKEIGEDKAEAEALKRDSINFREEVEDERKMLQMAEVWREERVQMKLVDAKVMLEEKYCQMNQLVAELETFLSSRSATPNAEEMRRAEFLRQAAASVSMQDIRELKYEAPNPDDIFSVFENVNLGEADERDMEQCAGYSPASGATKAHTVSPDGNRFNDDNVQRRYHSGDREEDEDESGWETVSHPEEQGSSYSPEGSNTSFNGVHRDCNMSGSATEWEENAPITDISEVSAVLKTQSKKVPTISRLWKSRPSNAENLKVVLGEGTNGRLSNGRLSNGSVISSDRGSGKGRLSPPNMEQWSSPDSENPHIARGMRGCIEWPRGMQKGSLKAKLLEARMESQKIQLRQVLKQKI